VPQESPPQAADDQIDALALLKDPVRRALFDFVTRAPGDVSREEAAEALGVGRTLAAFHLDKLVGHGLLEVSFRRLTGRSGPGAGRPAKLYRRSDRQITVTVPAREYELAARLLARAVDEAHNGAVAERLSALAREVGSSLAREQGARARTRAARLRELRDRLADLGFEPYQERSTVYLRNCPFHRLSADHRSLICGMNLELIRGACEGAGTEGVDVRLDPAPDRCCVVLEPARGSLSREPRG
jgi:predicted ArsR family transcriptional regulator